MKTRALALLLVLAAVACEQSESGSGDTSASRQTIAVEYVRTGELPIRRGPQDDAPVIATYSRGSSVSVLSHRGDWDEVRVADRSGWVRAAALGTASEAQKAEADILTPSFRVAPAPVTSSGAHGEIVLEASVNQDGEVLDVRLLTNTTGSPELAARNTRSLRLARFEPIMQHGARKPFTYEYRVHY
jgi:TonB family protein